MLALVGAKPLNLSSKTAGLQDSKSSGQTAQRNASNKKRVRLFKEKALKSLSETGMIRSMDKSTMADPLQFRALWESPWQQYEKVYNMEIAGAVEVAVRKVSPIELVHIRSFSNSEAEKALHMFQQLQHCNLVTALDAFATDNGLYVVLKYMSISLEQIISSPVYPDERELAVILEQMSSA